MPNINAKPYWDKDPYLLDFKICVLGWINTPFREVFETLATDVFPHFCQELQLNSKLEVLPLKEEPKLEKPGVWAEVQIQDRDSPANLALYRMHFTYTSDQDVRVRVREWIERFNLRFNWMEEVAMATMGSWRVSIDKNALEDMEMRLGPNLGWLRNAYERRDWFIPIEHSSPPDFLKEARVFTLRYEGWQHAYARGKVKEEITSRFEAKLKEYLDNVETLLDENGYKQAKFRPELERNCCFVVLRVLKGKRDNEVLDFCKDLGIFVTEDDVRKAFDWFEEDGLIAGSDRN